MRDRTHKERTHYVLRMGDGMLVTVPEVVYLEWYRSRRREKYQKEKERKHGVCSLEALEESGNYPRQEGDSLEETVLKKMCRNKIRKAVEELRAGDRYLVYLLYYKEVPVLEAARLCGCSKRTIQNRRKKILEELRGRLQGSCARERDFGVP